MVSKHVFLQHRSEFKEKRFLTKKKKVLKEFLSKLFPSALYLVNWHIISSQ